MAQDLAAGDDVGIRGHGSNPSRLVPGLLGQVPSMEII